MFELKRSLSLVLSCSLVGGGPMAGSLLAQEPLPPAQQQITFLAPNAAQRQKDRRRWGRPTTRTPGGTRDSCAQKLIALVPSPDTMALSTGQCLEESISDRALTQTERPTLWFYIPQLAEQERRAELVLLQDHREVYSQRVKLPAEAGIFGLQLQRPLTANQLYGWSFTVLTQPRSPSQNPTVEGLIRYSTAGSTALSGQKGRTSGGPQRYAQAGIWHDALTALAQRRCQDPGDRAWRNFLNSAGLDAIATSPILNCEVLN